jgi:heme/copper-type cytochrome/quinol oxidase subunit 2
MDKILIQFAQKLNADELNIPTTTGQALFDNGLNIAYFIAGIIAVIVIIISGFVFVTAGSDSNMVAKSKNAILYSSIGLVIIISAFVITQFIIGRF